MCPSWRTSFRTHDRSRIEGSNGSWRPDQMQMSWLGNRLDQLKAPAMLQRGNARAHRRHQRRIDLSHDHAGLATAFGDDAAPRIDHDRVAVCVAAMLVPPTLGRRKNETAVFDRACARQNMPVGLAG